MVDPYPGIVDGENIILYNSTEQLFDLLKWYLEHPEEADRIAENGRSLAATWTPTFAVESMIKLLNWRPKIRVYQFPFIEACINEEYEFIAEGLNGSGLVTVVPDLKSAQLMILDLHRLGDCADLFKRDPTVKERARMTVKAAREAGIKILALDFNDRPWVYQGGYDYALTG